MYQNNFVQQHQNIIIVRMPFLKLYLVYIRPIVKILMHLITRKCEIERVALANDYQGMRRSIAQSKALHDFVRGELRNRDIFNSDLATKFCKIKNISNERSKFYVVKMLRQVYAADDALRIISKKREQKYSKQNPKNQEKLLKIWKNLKKSDIKQRYTEQWISIGFQDKDPATDFRGAGVLGLQNLYQFTGKKYCFEKVFKVASSPKTEYFFASAGLYFTMLSLQIMKLNLLPEQFWLGTQQDKNRNFQDLYNFLFVSFDNYWTTCEDKSLLSFNKNLDQFAKTMKSKVKASLKQQIVIVRQKIESYEASPKQQKMSKEDQI